MPMMIKLIKTRLNAILERFPPKGLSYENWSMLRKLPGMVTVGERRRLYEYARCSTEDIVEFGTFFGSSAGALASGLIKRPQPTSQKVYLYDAFETEATHSFARHVVERAEAYGLINRIELSKETVSWRKLTDYLLRNWQGQYEINQIVIEPGQIIPGLPIKIGLLHLDMPKDLPTATPIVEQVFPRCEPGSVIAFQDYYYHFSGDLIAFFEFAQDSGLLFLEKSEGCTAFFRVNSRLPEGLMARFRQSTDILSEVAKAVDNCFRSSCTSHQQVSLAMACLETRVRLRTDCSSLSLLQRDVAALIDQCLRLNEPVSLRCLSEILTERIIALHANCP